MSTTSPPPTPASTVVEMSLNRRTVHIFVTILLTLGFIIGIVFSFGEVTATQVIDRTCVVKSCSLIQTQLSDYQVYYLMSAVFNLVTTSDPLANCYAKTGTFTVTDQNVNCLNLELSCQFLYNDPCGTVTLGILDGPKWPLFVFMLCILSPILICFFYAIAARRQAAAAEAAKALAASNIAAAAATAWNAQISNQPIPLAHDDSEDAYERDEEMQVFPGPSENSKTMR